MGMNCTLDKDYTKLGHHPNSSTQGLPWEMRVNPGSKIVAGTHAGGLLGAREKALRAALPQAMRHQVPDPHLRDKAPDG